MIKIACEMLTLR